MANAASAADVEAAAGAARSAGAPGERAMNPDARVELFAVAAPGLEAVVARELRGLGVRGRVVAGGVAWAGTLHDVYDANLRLRTASRVLLRVARFDARAFSQLERAARRIEWARFIAPGTPVRVNVTCRRSRLYHERAVAERVLEAIERAGGVPVAPADGGAERTGVGAAADDARDDSASDDYAQHDDARDDYTSHDDASHGDASRDDAFDDYARHDDASHGDARAGGSAQSFVVRIHRDRCTISADTSGALLHRRGYREAVAKAPIRETLAAAMLLAAEWPVGAPLLDPLCGSGTIAIEAALMARRIPPGLASAPRRRFAFEYWPEADPALLEDRIAAALDEVLPAAPAPIAGSDRDAGAIKAARANAERAGVAADIEFERLPLSAAEPAGAAGWLVTNPPYGARVGRPDRLADLYAALGNLVRRRLSDWTVVMLSADRRLDAQTRLRFDELLRTRNGGLRVRLLRARPPHAG